MVILEPLGVSEAGEARTRPMVYDMSVCVGAMVINLCFFLPTVSRWCGSTVSKVVRFKKGCLCCTRLFFIHFLVSFC